jgi:acyl carrier protein
MRESPDVIRADLRGFLAERFYIPNPDQLPDDASLLEKGIVNSAGFIELIGFLEERFQIVVEHEEILQENLDSVDRLLRFVLQKLEDEGPPPAP